MRSPGFFLPFLRRLHLTREALMACLFSSLVLPAHAVPTWWASRGATVSGAQQNDFAALNQGQLKQLVTAAVAEMNARLPGGAGNVLNRMVASWQADTRHADDFAVTSLRQLKMAALPVLRRLKDVEPLSALPSWVADLPNTEEEDNAVANVGQAKNLFNFSIPDQVTDTDGDGFTDAEEILLGTNPSSNLSHPLLPGHSWDDLPGGTLAPDYEWNDYPNEAQVNRFGKMVSWCTLEEKQHNDSTPSYWRNRGINDDYINTIAETGKDSFQFIPGGPLDIYPSPVRITGFGGASSVIKYYLDNFDEGDRIYYKFSNASVFNLYVKPLVDWNTVPPRTVSFVKRYAQVPVGSSHWAVGSVGITQTLVFPSRQLPKNANGDYFLPDQWYPVGVGVISLPWHADPRSLELREEKTIAYNWVEVAPPLSAFSLSDAAGPKFRKIGLNGFPLSDSKPQAQDESGELPEETYVDAYSRQLKHSVSDVYVSTESSLLPLQVRREVVPESWSRRFGSLEEKRDKPFGPGWSSNLAPVVCVESRGGDTTRAIVTDEQGGQRSFLYTGGTNGVWYNTREQTKNGKTMFDRFVAGPGGNTYVLYQKFGTTCTYEETSHTVSRPVDRMVQGSDGSGYNDATWVGYNYARLISVEDRLGNKLLYQYEDEPDGTDSLIPNVIYDPARPAHRISIQQQDGRVVKVQGPDGEQIHYAYENMASPGADPKPTSFKVLKSVKRSAHNAEPPVLGGVSYAYDAAAAIDITPDPADAIRTEYIHLELSGITDERGNTYAFTYGDFDLGWQADYPTGDTLPRTRIQRGVPRLLTQIQLPTDPGHPPHIVNIGGTRGAHINLAGKVQNASATTVVSGPAGDFRYVFDQPSVSIPYLPYGRGFLAAEGNQRTLSFKRLTLYHGLTMEPSTPKETFEFNPQAAMALRKVTDLNGNVTSYGYSDPVFLYRNPTTNEISSQSIFYDDPTVEVDAARKRKTYTYDKATRVMTSMRDQRGILTKYDLKQPAEGQTATGLRIKETVSDTRVIPARVLKVTDFTYDHPRFKGFLTKQKVHAPLTAAEGQEAIGEMVTEFAPDLNGRVKTQTVWAGTYTSLRTRYEYSNGGMKTVVTDPRNLTTRFEYAPDTRRLEKVTHPDGSFKSIAYDAHGNIERETNENGVITFHDYDALNRKTRTTVDLNGNGSKDGRYTSYSPPGAGQEAVYNGDIVTETAYNALNLPKDEWDARGTRTHHEYDVLGRRTETTVNYGGSPAESVHITKFENYVGGSAFDVSVFKPGKITDPRGFVATFEFDPMYRVTEKTLTDTSYSSGHPARSVVTKTVYDEVGNPVKQTDALNRTTETVYDGLNRPITITHPGDAGTFAATVQTFYTPGGQVWKTVDEMGAVTRQYFDNAGRQYSKVLPAVLNQATGTMMSPVIQQEFDAGGNVVKVTDPLNNVTQTVYDQRNRPWRVKSPAVADASTGQTAVPVVQTNYDALGQVTGTTDPLGHFTEKQYDRAGRVLKVIAPPIGSQTHVTSSTYDPAGNILTVTNAKGQTITNTYDVHNRLTSTLDAENILSTFGYDKAGNRNRVLDGLEQESLFVYDAQNRLKSQTYSNDSLSGDTWTYGYDAVNKTGQTDAKNVVTSYTYDARNRLKTVNATGLSRLYTYDRAGRILSVEEAGKPQAEVRYTYDSHGRILSETSRGVQHVYGYDLAGNRTHAAYGTGKVVATTYDALNRPATITEGGRLTSYGYDLAGRALVLIAGNGQATENAYDALGRLIQRTLYQNHASRVPAGVLAEFGWGYDSISNVTSHAENWKTTSLRPAGVRVTTMNYDDANRLEQEVVSTIVTGTPTLESTTGYTYDDAGNRQTKTVTGGAEAGYWEYDYNPANQLTVWRKYASLGGSLQKSAGLSYDANGNRISQEVVGQVAGSSASLTNQGITYQSKTGGTGGEDLSVTLEKGTSLASRIENGDEVIVTLETGAATPDSLIRQGVTYTTVDPHQDGQEVSLELAATPDQAPAVQVTGNHVKVLLETTSGAAAARDSQDVHFQAKTAGQDGNDIRVRLEKAAVGAAASASVTGNDVIVKLETDAGSPDVIEDQDVTYTSVRARSDEEKINISLLASEESQDLEATVNGNDIEVLLETDAGGRASVFDQGIHYTAVAAGAAGNNLRVLLQAAPESEAFSVSLQGNDVIARLATEDPVSASQVVSGITYTATEAGAAGNGIVVEHVNEGPNRPLEVRTEGREITVSLATSVGDAASASLYGGAIVVTAVTPGVEGNELVIGTEARNTPNEVLEASVESNGKLIRIRSATDSSGMCTTTFDDMVQAIQNVAGHLVTVTGGGSTLLPTGNSFPLSGGGANYVITSTKLDVVNALSNSAPGSALATGTSPDNVVAGTGSGTLAGGLDRKMLTTGEELVTALKANTAITAKMTIAGGIPEALRAVDLRLEGGGENRQVKTTVSQLVTFLSGHTAVSNLVDVSGSGDAPVEERVEIQLVGGSAPAVETTTADLVSLLSASGLQAILPLTVSGGSAEEIVVPATFNLVGGGEDFEITSTVTDVVGLLTHVSSPAAGLLTASGSSTDLAQPFLPTVLSGGAAPVVTTADQVVTLLASHSLLTVTGGGSHRLLPQPRMNLDGVTATSQTTTYAWNSEDRLTGVTMPDGTFHQYAYDYRVRRVQTDRAGTAPQTTAIVFAGGLSLAEYESATPAAITPGSPTVHYLRGPDMGGGVGGMLYSLRGSTLKYSLNNGRGDIIAQSDENAALTWTASYEAYGKRPVETGTNADKQRANSKDEDPTGLLNEGFRYRDLETGTWLSRDPAGFVDGPNLYAYVQQNPWTKFDSKGLFWSAIVTAGFAAYDTYQYATGQISGGDYAGRMALNGAAFVADVATAGNGGGLVVRAAATSSRVVTAVVKTAKAVDRANDMVEKVQAAVETGESLVDAVTSAGEGDVRGLLKVAADSLTDAAAKKVLGAKAGGKGDMPKGPVKPGQTGTYGELKAQKKAFGETEALDMDHQPSFAAQVAAEEAASGRKLTAAEKAVLKANTPAVASPRAVHQQTSPTYGGRNTRSRIAEDSADLDAAAERDRAAFDKAMKKR